MLKNRKYFDYLKANKRILNDSRFDEIRSANASGYETIIKLQKGIAAKLEGEFDNLDKPTTQGFDLSKLEEMKEKSNKNFFEDMNKIKAGKGVGNKVSKTTTDDDLLGLGGVQKPEVKTEVTKQAKKDDLLDLQSDFMNLNVSAKPVQQKSGNDFLDLGFGAQPVQSQSHNTQAKSKTNANDLFDLGMVDLTPKPTPAFQQPKPTPNTVNFDPLFSFDQPSQSKAQNNTAHNQFETVDTFLGEVKSQPQKPAPPKSSDPFNFTVF